MERVSLPVDRVLPDLVRAVTRHGAAVLVAPTGSGKTTRVAPALLDMGPGEVWLLEPRRIATRAAAARIAEERGARLGDEVGYQVRFENVRSKRTRLIVATTGIFLRRLVADPLLEGVRAVLFDEIHERSLELDLCLALARAAKLGAREDLQLVAMSATLDPGPLVEFLGQAPLIVAEGRTFPVTLSRCPAFGGEELKTTLRRALESEASGAEGGDVLVFLPGMGEIRAAARELSGLANRLGFELFELYGDLPPERQDAVFRPGSRPKLILSTNVAESSLTLPNVTLVIDTGLERRQAVDPGTGLERLELKRIALASAEQRRGRAGRVRPGRCVRLWSEQEERAFEARIEPEVRRANLSRAVLDLFAWGEPDPARFGWFEAPRPEALLAAEKELVDLGALEHRRLTRFGNQLVELPLAPRLGSLLLAGAELGVPGRAALAAALLSERDPLRSSPHEPQGDSCESDILLRIEALERFEAEGREGPLHPGAARALLRTRDQLLRALGGRSPLGRPARDPDRALLEALLRAFPDRLAKRREPASPRARLFGGLGIELSPRSRVRHAPLFLALSVDAERRRGGDLLCHLASAVELDWLDPKGFSDSIEARFDSERERAVGVRRRYWKALLLEEQDHGGLDQASAEAVLLEAARQAPERALDLKQPESARLMERIAWLAEQRPDLELPSFGIGDWDQRLQSLVSGRRSFEELRRIDLSEWIPRWLSPLQAAALEREAPATLLVPSGSRLRVDYSPGRTPVLAARIQELFGLAETPRVLSGRQPVLMHLLAPSGRPQQVTEDLRSFWNGAYHTIKKELARRYPRHSWPDDPWTAEAQRRPKPKPR